MGFWISYKWNLKLVGGRKPKTAMENLKMATLDPMSKDKELLVEIPQDFTELMKNDVGEAKEWRLKIRKVLEEYMNKKNYKVCNFLHYKKGDYYLLSAD